MDFKYFFWQSDDIFALGKDIGFDLYSAGHLIWLTVIAAASALMGWLYVKAGGGRRIVIEKACAAALLIFEIYKDTVLFIIGRLSVDYLPFHLCGLAIGGLLIDAFCRNQKISGQLIAYGFMPGALSALLFCNWTEYPFLNFMNIHSFLFHGLIVCYMVMRYAGGEIKPNYKGIWQTVGILAVFAVPIYFFNKAFDTNYMFLNEASEGSPLVILWDLFGEKFGEPGYLISYAVLAITVFHVLYLVYRILGKIINKGNKGEKCDEEKTSDMLVA